MDKQAFFDAIRGGVLISCQALPHEPLHGAANMALMAIAAKQGGAVGIRSNSAVDVRAIKDATALPVIGLKKIGYADSDIYITPTLDDILEIADAGADCVAFDCTHRARPFGQSLEDLVRAVRARTDVLLMADISTYEEGIFAERLGIDLVSTTLSGYTPYSPQAEAPDFDLMRRLAADLRIPVCAEGRIWTREQAVEAKHTGVFALIIGSSVTRPQDITRRFIEAVDRK